MHACFFNSGKELKDLEQELSPLSAPGLGGCCPLGFLCSCSGFHMYVSKSVWDKHLTSCHGCLPVFPLDSIKIVVGFNEASGWAGVVGQWSLAHTLLCGVLSCCSVP